MTTSRRSVPRRLTRRGTLAGSAIGLTALGLAVAAARWLHATPARSVMDAVLAGPFGDIWVGSPEAKVMLIEYGAVTCSHCAAFHDQTWPLLKARWVDTGQVRFALRGFPLGPLDVAGFMVARSDGGRNYYAVTDLLFERQASWAFVPKPLDAMRDLLRQAGISRERFDAILNDQALYDAVNGVRAQAASELGVHVTPTLFVNGSRQEGALSDEALGAIIGPALGERSQ